MEDFLHLASGYSVLAINIMALIVIVFGTLEAFWSGLRVMLNPSQTEPILTSSYVRFGRWLVAGLTFQLAADVIETATTSTADGWYDIGRLAAVAVIRTFLSYFLERDMREMAKVGSNPTQQAELLPVARATVVGRLFRPNTNTTICMLARSHRHRLELISRNDMSRRLSGFGRSV